ncbi:MAG: alpha/beta hydrolase [Pseudomonadota bacterium]
MNDKVDLEFYYEDTGPPPNNAGPVVVFSHGFLMDHTMWEPQVSALKDRYRCITWDQRGHGLTATDRLDPFTFYDSANDLAALLTHLGIEKAVLAGMSQGGYLTLRAAIINPGIVDALVLIDTQTGLMDKSHLTGNFQLLNAWLTTGLSDGLAAKVAAEILKPNWPGAAPWIAKWKATKLVNLAMSFRTLVTRDDITPYAPAIKTRSLVVYGQNDLAVPPKAIKAMAAALHAETYMVKGAGHASCLTNPEQVNPQIEAFLKERACA